MDNSFFKETLINDKEILRELYEYFLNIEWTQDTYVIQGRSVTPKRKTFMYGKVYSYSGITKNPVPFDDNVLLIANKIEEKLNLPSGYFNGCLCNLYEDGEAYISYHKDDEKQMDKDALIVAISFGQTRKFYLKNDKTKEVEKLIHGEGEIIVMYPETQDNWKHSVPKETKVTEPRISLTFRRFLS